MAARRLDAVVAHIRAASPRRSGAAAAAAAAPAAGEAAGEVGASGFHIATIAPGDAAGELRAAYARYAKPDGSVDNIDRAHSLNPAALVAHEELYRQCMKAPGPLSRVEREVAGVVVSVLNGCMYWGVHHRAGLRDALPEGRKGVAAALARRDWAALTPRELAIARYAEKLTRAPAAVGAADVRALRGAGLSDREVHDAAVVVAYFAFANRVVHGLGVPLGGDEGAPGQ